MPLSGLWVGGACLYVRRMNEGWMLYPLGILPGTLLLQLLYLMFVTFEQNT
jgi:hypothetical protein